MAGWSKMSSWNSVEEYLSGAKIINMKTSSEARLEGGQVIVFEKDRVVGITIMGYTELGSWTYLFIHGDDYYYDEDDVGEAKRSMNREILSAGLNRLIPIGME